MFDYHFTLINKLQCLITISHLLTNFLLTSSESSWETFSAGCIPNMEHAWGEGETLIIYQSWHSLLLTLLKSILGLNWDIFRTTPTFPSTSIFHLTPAQKPVSWWTVLTNLIITTQCKDQGVTLASMRTCCPTMTTCWDVSNCLCIGLQYETRQST